MDGSNSVIADFNIWGEYAYLFSWWRNNRCLSGTAHRSLTSARISGHYHWISHKVNNNFCGSMTCHHRAISSLRSVDPKSIFKLEGSRMFPGHCGKFLVWTQMFWIEKFCYTLEYEHLLWLYILIYSTLKVYTTF